MTITPNNTNAVQVDEIVQRIADAATRRGIIVGMREPNSWEPSEDGQWNAARDEEFAARAELLTLLGL